jgi:hypothetical protein
MSLAVTQSAKKKRETARKRTGLERVVEVVVARGELLLAQLDHEVRIGAAVVILGHELDAAQHVQAHKHVLGLEELGLIELGRLILVLQQAHKALELADLLVLLTQGPCVLLSSVKVDCIERRHVNHVLELIVHDVATAQILGNVLFLIVRSSLGLRKRERQLFFGVELVLGRDGRLPSKQDVRDSRTHGASNGEGGERARERRGREEGK